MSAALNQSAKNTEHRNQEQHGHDDEDDGLHAMRNAHAQQAACDCAFQCIESA